MNALADGPFERGGESVHCTALQVAVATKQPEVAQLLLERGADPNIGDHEGKITPLMYTKCAECQKLLLDAKADITVFDQLFGRNAFHWACYDGKVIDNETARLLSVCRSLTSVLRLASGRARGASCACRERYDPSHKAAVGEATDGARDRTGEGPHGGRRAVSAVTASSWPCLPSSRRALLAACRRRFLDFLSAVALRAGCARWWRSR